MDSRKLLIVFAGFVVITALAVYYLATSPQVLQTEELENGAEILTVKESVIADRSSVSTKIRYERGGRTYESFFISYLRPALDHITKNTVEDAKVAAWWDYGHMIRGYTGRDVVSYTPTEWAYKHTAVTEPGGWNTKNRGELASTQTMYDLAAMFVEPPEQAKELFSEYGVSHVMITRQDIGKYAAITKVYGQDESQFSSLQRIRCESNGGRCRVQVVDGKQYLIFSQSSGRFLVPVAQEARDVVINGTIEYQQQGQTITVQHCSNTTEQSSDALPGCIAFSPFHSPLSVVHVPEEAVDDTFTQLLLSDNPPEGFSPVYTDTTAKIWAITGS